VGEPTSAVVLVICNKAVGILHTQEAACCVVALVFDALAQCVGDGVQVALAPVVAVCVVVAVGGGVAIGILAAVQ